MRVVMWTIAILLAWSTWALAFKNIEADTLYDGPIKQQIFQEFTHGLKLLKAQAEGLGMEMRDKDVKALNLHMYYKALLIGECADRAITVKKTTPDKILSNKYVSECIDTHLKFMNDLQDKKWTNSMTTCLLQSENFHGDVNPPYDFLSIEPYLTVTDYISLKKCFDNRSETDKFGDKFLH
jgi:hypothetical protein